MELEQGASVDKYVVEELLGRGGMASVYKVRHDALGASYALKVLDLPSQSVRERLKSEGAFQAALRHPNVVSVVDVIVLENSPALVLEYVNGPSLEGLLKIYRPTIEQIDELARGVIKGVRAAHRHGLIHRDLKPANILLQRADDGFVPKIADFGLAKAVGSENTVSRTRSGMMMGTPAYMAPEQFASAKDVDARADVYSLGVTLYELVTGRLPFTSQDLVDLLVEIKGGKFPTPSELVPGLPERMEKAILGAIVRDPANRLASVDAFYAAWCGKDEVADDAQGTWSRNVLDSVSTSVDRSRGSGASGNSKPSGATFRATGIDAGSLIEARAPAITTRPPRLARRLAPYVAVMGVGLVALIAFGGAATSMIGVAALTMGTEPVSAPIPADPVPVEEAPAVAEPLPADAPAPIARPTPIPAPPIPELAEPSSPAAPRPKPTAAPRPKPTAPAPQLGSWAASGPVESISLVDGAGKAWPQGQVPAGTYQLRVKFSGRAEETSGSFKVEVGTTLRMKCSASFFACRAE